MTRYIIPRFEAVMCVNSVIATLKTQKDSDLDQAQI